MSERSPAIVRIILENDLGVRFEREVGLGIVPKETARLAIRRVLETVENRLLIDLLAVQP